MGPNRKVSVIPLMGIIIYKMRTENKKIKLTIE